MRHWPRIALGLVFPLLPVPAAAADHVAIAAAANLTYALRDVDAAFVEANPGVVLTAEMGASGNLVTQIVNGAPYDVFLSADLQYPQKLIQAGGAEGPTLTVFAIGRLVLWTTRPGLRLDSVASVVRDPAVQRLAIANPRAAPYGRAAQEALTRLKLEEAAKPKLVFGEDITQTAQYVFSGNADAGFVALSLVLSPKLKDHGRWLEVPPALYAPLQQGALLTRRGADNPAARRYLDFLRSPAARAVFERFGYRLPP